MSNRSLGYVCNNILHNGVWYEVWASPGSIRKPACVSVFNLDTRQTIFKEEGTDKAYRMVYELSDEEIVRVALGEITVEQAFEEHRRKQEEARINAFHQKWLGY